MEPDGCTTADAPPPRTRPTFSERTSWNLEQTSYTLALQTAGESACPLLDLTGSNPTRCGVQADPALLTPLCDPHALTYRPDPRGLPSARDAVSAYYRDHHAAVDPNALVLTSSTSESYSFLFRLLCDPGDEVLIAQPSYPLFDLLAQLDSIRLTHYPVFHDHGWWINLNELQRRITPRTRAIIVVHPNNPTGHWTRHSERLQLEQLCARFGLALVLDEVFLDYPLSPQPAASFATGPHPALTFVLSGLSKIAALPQMKAAWIATLGPEALAREALARLEVIADTFLSVSTPIQLALPSWLAARHAIQAKILARTHTNLVTLNQFAGTHPDRLHLLPPEAGWTAIVSLPACGGDPACAERLIRERGIVLHPGSFYGIGEPNRAVLSLLTPPEILAQALARL